MAGPNTLYIPVIQRDMAEARFFDVLAAMRDDFGLIDATDESRKGGQYIQDPIYGQMSAAFERADVNTTLSTGLTPRTTTRKNQVMVTCHRTSLFEYYISEASQAGKSEAQIDAEYNRQAGIFAAKRLILDMYNVLIAAASTTGGAVSHKKDVYVDTGVEANKKKLSPVTLNQAKALMGDQMNNLDVAITAGLSMADMEAVAIATASGYPVWNVMGEVFSGGIAAMKSILGMTFIADDNLPATAGGSTNSPAKYRTLLLRSKKKHPMGLAPVQVSYQVPLNIVHQHVLGLTGGAKLQRQVHLAYSIGIRGLTWDVGNGGANPTDIALATATNWDAAYDSHKDIGYALLNHN